jgi:hypothetical protein
VEPFSLAAAAVALLTPLLQRAVGRFAEQGADALADAAVPTVKRLYQALKDRLRPGTYAGSQLEGVEQRPDSESRQQALRSALAEELEADPTFAAEVNRLVGEAQAAGGVQLTVSDVGVVAGRDVHQRGQYVAGRDLNIGNAGQDQQ